MSQPPTVRFRVDFAGGCSVGAGKIELLAAVSRTRSLSKAARAMRMSYRRAWLLVEDLNTSFDRPVAQATVGGRGGGGMSLTPFGQQLVDAFISLQSRLQHVVATKLRSVAGHVVAERGKIPIRPASIRAAAGARRKRAAAA